MDITDFLRDVETAKRKLEKYNVEPACIYMSRKQADQLAEKLKKEGLLRSGQGGIDHILGLEVKIWENMLPDEIRITK